MQNKKDIEQACLSILFVSGEAVSCANLAAVLETDLEYFVSVIDEIICEREENGCGILIKRFDDKLRLCTNQQHSKYIKRLLAPEITEKLSNAVLETLAVIAYRQPVTRAEVESIRGVRCDYTISMLLEKGMIVESGRKNVIGRPRLFSTSDTFLQHFGISNLSELPIVETECDQIEELTV